MLWYAYEMSLRRQVKALMTRQPVNRAVTTAAKALTTITGGPPEWLAKHLPRVGDVSVPLPNGSVLNLSSPGDDPIANRVYWWGLEGYEPETARIWFALARRASTIFDLGAFTGYFSILASLSSPSAQVHAFEPIPELYERLRKNVALNRLSHVTCVPSAAGRVDGPARFFRGTDAVPSCSSLSRTFAQVHCSSVHEIEVPVVRLDTYASRQGIQTVELLKIDTESTEPDVLAGMPLLLERSHPHIICEVFAGDETGRTLETLLEPFGYRYYLLTDGGLQPKAHITADSRWRNQLFSTADLAVVLRDDR